MKKIKRNVLISEELSKALDTAATGTRRGGQGGASGIVEDALRVYLDPANRMDHTAELTKAERKAVDKLLWILRHQHEKAPGARAAVLANIEIFYDYLEIAEEEDRITGRKRD